MGTQSADVFESAQDAEYAEQICKRDAGNDAADDGVYAVERRGCQRHDERCEWRGYRWIRSAVGLQGAVWGSESEGTKCRRKVNMMGCETGT